MAAEHEDCVFCDIAKRNHPANIILENDYVFVIRDIMPKAPIHFLVISKQHVGSVNDLTADDQRLIAEIVLVAKAQAQADGIAEKGYKLIWNVGKQGGQVIPHLHLHVMGGKQLSD